MHRTLAPLFVVLALGCDDSAPLSEAGFGLRMQVDATSVASGVADADGSLFTVDAATVHVEEIDLYLPVGTTCADLDPAAIVAPVSCGVDKLVVAGPFDVDLIGGASEPSLSDIALPALAYSRVDVEMAPGADGVTMALGGAREDGAAWGLLASFDVEARFDGLADFTAATGGDAVLLMDPGVWFAAASLESCLDSGELVAVDGIVDLEDQEGACDDFADAFANAVEDSGRLEDDLDDDGVGDDDEGEDETETETEDTGTETEDAGTETETETEDTGTETETEA